MPKEQGEGQFDGESFRVPRDGEVQLTEFPQDPDHIPHIVRDRVDKLGAAALARGASSGDTGHDWGIEPVNPEAQPLPQSSEIPEATVMMSAKAIEAARRTK